MLAEHRGGLVLLVFEADLVMSSDDIVVVSHLLLVLQARQVLQLLHLVTIISHQFDVQ